MKNNMQTMEETIWTLADRGNHTAREIAELALREADPDGRTSLSAKAILLTNLEMIAVKALRRRDNPVNEAIVEKR
jgi:hypothetical protein